jgi:hypothetical protein
MKDYFASLIEEDFRYRNAYSPGSAQVMIIHSKF